MLLLLLHLLHHHLSTPLSPPSLTINPSWVEEGGKTTLSCSYSLPSSLHPQLDVKWYHGASPSPFLLSLPALQPRPQLVDPSFASHVTFLQHSPSHSSFTLSNLTLALGQRRR